MTRVECWQYSRLCLEMFGDRCRFRPRYEDTYAEPRSATVIRNVKFLVYDSDYEDMPYEGYVYNEDDVNFWISVFPDLVMPEVYKMDAMYISRHILKNLPRQISTICFSNTESLSYLQDWMYRTRDAKTNDLTLQYTGKDSFQFDVAMRLNANVSHVDFPVKDIVSLLTNNPQLREITIDLDYDCSIVLPRSDIAVNLKYSSPASKTVFTRLNPLISL